MISNVNTNYKKIQVSLEDDIQKDTHLKKKEKYIINSDSFLYIKAYFLWFFFGVFGVHRLYLKCPISGNLYLATLGLFGLGWLFDSYYTYKLVKRYIQNAKKSEPSFEQKILNEFEELDKQDEKETVRNVTGTENESPTFAILFFNFIIESILITSAITGVYFLLIYFDQVLIAFPIIFVWIVLLISNKKVNLLKENIFILKDFPVNIENTLSATALKVFFFQKGYKITYIKYLLYPLYMIIYLIAVLKRDKEHLEFKELLLFFRLYSGIFLIWITIEISRYYSIDNSIINFFYSTHPLYIIFDLIKGSSFSTRYILNLYFSSIILFLCLIYLSQIVNIVIIRNQFELNNPKVEHSVPLTLRILIIAIITVFTFGAIGTLVNDKLERMTENSSPRKIETIVYIMYEKSTIDKIEEAIKHYLLYDRIGNVLLESVLTKEGLGRDKVVRSFMDTLKYKIFLEKYKTNEDEIIPKRYNAFINFHPLNVKNSDNSNLNIVLTIDNVKEIKSELLDTKKVVYPIVIIQVKKEYGSKISIDILRPRWMSENQNVNLSNIPEYTKNYWKDFKITFVTYTAYQEASNIQTKEYEYFISKKPPNFFSFIGFE